jgi:phosphatidylglycerophosphate synthase
LALAGVMVGMESEHAAGATVAAAASAPRATSRSRARSGRSGEVTNAGVDPVAGLIAQILLLSVLAIIVGLSSAGWLVGVTSGVIIDAALFRGLSRSRTGRLNLAGWVTFVRATLAVGVAALVAESFDRPAPVTALVLLAALALMLDAVDGQVARRTRTAGTLGAHFDAEVDAFLILVLSIYVARSVGAWVLAIGAARYVFLAAAWPLPWMRKPLPPRYWRRFVAATQGVVLTVVAADVLPSAVNRGALVVALVLLTESFIRDVWWLWAHRVTRSSGAAAVDAPILRRRTPSAPPSARRGPLRTGVATAVTVLAFAFLWAALVAPDRPSGLTLAAFLRVPLEGIVLVALALVLPVRVRRVLAGLLGVALGIVVILKMLDIGFFMAFERPFDPLGDSGYAGIGMETLTAAVGKTDAKLIAVGVVVGTIVVLAGTTLSMLRLSAVAARNPRFSLRAVSALGVVWVICWLFGAQLVSRSPIASTSAAGLIVREVHTVQADIHDKGVFAKEIAHDRFRYTPGNKLLSALRGKDVVLVFVESYGKVSVENSSMAPAIDADLEKGNQQLQASGFGARTAFLTSSTFGGVSWLAHSTLQSGVWANTQLRYNQLVGTNRLTLSDAFKRAGWRTVADSPADDRVWADGKTFYHYDAIYNRGNVGYHGPTYTYASMPDQYLYLGLQRLELGKRKRPPIFAEVDTVSSHMPWNRVPESVIPWNQVGNGSIFKHEPTEKNLDGPFWITPKRVRASYAHSIEYSMNALVSYVKHYGRKNLVLLVVGDEQPLPIVSGEGASHDVPISIIAHDPKVLKQIGSWGWGAGLRPSPKAPVWPMSAFRDRFLTAYGSTPAG